MTETPRPTKDTDKNVKPTGDAIRRALPKFLMEMLAITFGVILAFMLNEWRVDMKRDAFVERSLAAIEEELAQNYEEVMSRREYRLKIYKSIQEVKRGSLTVSEFRRDIFRGTRPPRMRSAAYEIGIQSAILSDIPIEDAKSIATAYATLDDLRNLHGRYSSASMSGMLTTQNSDGGYVSFLSAAFTDFLYAEEETLIAISNVIERPPFESWWKILYPQKRPTKEAPSDAASKPQSQAEHETVQTK